MMRKIGLILVLSFATLLPVPLVADGIELIGSGEFAGDMSDDSGLVGDAAPGYPLNLLGGLSGLESTGAPDRFWALTDRGPADGDIDFPCRIHEIELPIPFDGRIFTPKLIATHLLSDPKTGTLRGRATLFDTSAPATSQRFDPEAVRLSPSGSWLISDEYGPVIAEFSRTGQRLAFVDVPSRYFIQHPAANKARENALNARGRCSNAGFEGLALSPSGERLYACVQRPLIQDCQGEPSAPSGRNCRLLEIDVKTARTREFVYSLDHPRHGVNEILAWGEGRFLAIERDDQPGELARFKRIVAFEIDGATDVSEIERLSADELPPSIRPVKKRLLIDLLDPRYGLAGTSFPEKVEGLAFGRALPDGRRVLVVGTDNDCEPSEPSRFWMFAVPETP